MTLIDGLESEMACAIGQNNEEGLRKIVRIQKSGVQKCSNTLREGNGIIASDNKR